MIVAVASPPTKPLEEHMTVRVDSALADAIDRELSYRERMSGIPIDRSKLVRLLVRVGLAAVKADREK